MMARTFNEWEWEDENIANLNQPLFCIETKKVVKEFFVGTSARYPTNPFDFQPKTSFSFNEKTLYIQKLKVSTKNRP